MKKNHLMILASAVLLAGCNKAVDVSPPPVVVYTLTTTASSAVESFELAGVVTSAVEGAIGFQAGGRIAERLVSTGEMVKAGQTLMRLDDRDLKLALAAALRDEQQAMQERDLAQRELVRLENLARDEAVSALDLDRARTRLLTAQARAEQAEQRRQLAANRLDYAVLKAPYAGTVTRISAEAGQVVAEGQAVISVAQAGSQLRIDVELTEAQRRALPGLQATLAETANGAPLLKLAELASQAGPARTWRARYEAPQGMLLGQLLTVQLKPAGSQGRAATRLPSSALITQGTATAVWRVTAEGTLQALPVQIMAQTSNEVMVDGIPNGTLVVSLGAFRLNGDEKVTALPHPQRGVQAEAREQP